jgi:uncharacterized protein (TIGR03083 family)
MTGTKTGEDLRHAITANRLRLAQTLSQLESGSWEAPTLCQGWRVREVAAHISMPFRYSTARFFGEVLRSGGRFNKMADRCAKRDSSLSPDELVAAIRDNAEDTWKPPGGGLEGALVHDVIHTLDVSVPLGIEHTIPSSTMRTVLDVIGRPKTVKYFGADLDGIELRADDLDWSFGSGEPVSGSAQALALVLCGRKLPTGKLLGASGSRFETT